VRKLSIFCLSCTVAVVLGFALVGERPALPEGSAAWVKSLRPGDPDSVLVLLLTDRSGVAAIRAALDPARILAETPDAIVLREGRVVATGPEFVGDPLMEAGFADRSIELWSATPAVRWNREEREDGELSLAALAQKPTLTLFEVMAVLNGSVR
jgi:hypothetical protein